MIDLPRALFLFALGVVIIAFLWALVRMQDALVALRHEAKLYGQLDGFWWDAPLTDTGKTHRAKLHGAVGLALACFALLAGLIGLSHVIY